jgi:hypothetical protein
MAIATTHTEQHRHLNAEPNSKPNIHAIYQTAYPPPTD